MKKLLSLLSILTISGATMPMVVAAAPHQKTNNSETLKRNKRQNINLENNEKTPNINLENNEKTTKEVVIQTGNDSDRLIFGTYDFDFKWLKGWGLNWILKINKSGIMKVLNLVKNHPEKAKLSGSVISGLICAGAAAYATDYLAQLGYPWPSTAGFFLEKLFGLLGGFMSYKILGSRIINQMINVISNPNFYFSAVWVAFEATGLKGQFGTVDNSGNVGEESTVSSSDSYYTADNDDDTIVVITNQKIRKDN